MSHDFGWQLFQAILLQWLLGIVLTLHVFPEEKHWSFPLVIKGFCVGAVLVLLVWGLSIFYTRYLVSLF